MTLRAIVYGLSKKNLTATWVVGDVTKTCVNPWQYLPVNLGAFMNAGGPMAALCGTVAATDIINAATAVTWGAAWDVPLSRAYSPSAVVEAIPTPGAMSSTPAPWR